MNYQPSLAETQYVLGKSPEQQPNVGELVTVKRMFGEVCRILQEDCAYCETREYRMCDRVNEVLDQHNIRTIEVGTPERKQ